MFVVKFIVVQINGQLYGSISVHSLSNGLGLRLSANMH